jgi:hypothetical protein
MVLPAWCLLRRNGTPDAAPLAHIEEQLKAGVL